MKNCYQLIFCFLAFWFPILLNAQTTEQKIEDSTIIEPQAKLLSEPQAKLLSEPKAKLLTEEDLVGQEETFVDQETFGVPIPVVGASPNSGTTYGVLFAVVSETDGHIDKILAPVAMYNGLIGYSADMNYLGFPSENFSYQLYFSHSTENFWEYNAEYHVKELWNKKNLFLDGEFEFSRESACRFFGFGPETTEEDESSYTARNIKGHVRLRWEFTPHLFLGFAIKGHRRWIRKGILEDNENVDEPIVSTLKKYPHITGIKGSYSLPLELSLVFDTRDDDVSPTSGIYTRFFLEGSPEWFMSSFSYRRIGGEIKGYIPWDSEAKFVTVLRGAFQYLDGKNIPFYELSMLGGGQTLRGYGEGRFYDQHFILFNAEQRIRIARFYAGEILLDLEGAIFFDAGQVMDSYSDIRLKSIQKVFGVGIRFVVRSQIVAKVDIGLGDDGNAIFAGLHYPF